MKKLIDFLEQNGFDISGGRDYFSASKCIGEPIFKGTNLYIIYRTNQITIKVEKQGLERHICDWIIIRTVEELIFLIQQSVYLNGLKDRNINFFPTIHPEQT